MPSRISEYFKNVFSNFLQLLVFNLNHNVATLGARRFYGLNWVARKLGDVPGLRAVAINRG